MKDEKKPPPLAYRPSVGYRDKIVKALAKKQAEDRRPSTNNTIESILLEYFKIS